MVICVFGSPRRIVAATRARSTPHLLFTTTLGYASSSRVVDAKRWVPDWKPQLWQAPGLEYYHTGPGFPEIEGPAEDPRLIYFNDGHTSDDEGADEDERDPEEDAELICRPRTAGNP